MDGVGVQCPVSAHQEGSGGRVVATLAAVDWRDRIVSQVVAVWLEMVAKALISGLKKSQKKACMGLTLRNSYAILLP